MSKVFSFLAGVLSGSVVGATAAILLAPESGEELRADARARWEEAIEEARSAMERTRREKEMEFERMKEAGKLR
ncbi:MAG TPA: YtxH domain-containing protein [Candidatus Sulfomarinibacteraceae bacterium]|nr:YtxH domain-containing protein [Candidatus Sulfomarinibacteraceae bacterium]